MSVCSIQPKESLLLFRQERRGIRRIERQDYAQSARVVFEHDPVKCLDFERRRLRRSAHFSRG